jgi:radical SAM superfamily enzyme YgiQ (UPF0313 family)|tara:strand:+ start:4265 stop:5713 length:1449 start_codon:yes stop_codon:yes gene_type:complete
LKISLINPPFLFPSKKEIVFSQCLGVRSLSAYLKQEGFHDVCIIDSLMQGFDNVKTYSNGYIVGLELDEIVSAIPKESAIIGISSPFSQLAPIVHDIAKLIKASFPEALLVMGGVYPSTQPELALTSSVDYIVVGEGETAILDMALGKNPCKIMGVYSPRKEILPNYPGAPTVNELDNLPFPDYELPDMERYFTISPRMGRGKTASLVTSRGCPFTCEFCSIEPVYGRRFRARSASKVLEEIKMLVDKFNVKTLEIEDDNFTLKKPRVIEILKGIIELNKGGAGLSWNTPNGVDIETLDEELISLIKKSNCTSLTLALEHGDENMLKIMKKRVKLKTMEKVVKLLAKYEIPEFQVFVIIGYPGETRERFDNCVTFLKRLRSFGSNMILCANNAQPYPGTQLTKRCFEEGILTDPNYTNFLVNKRLMSTAHFIPIVTPDFDEHEVKRRRLAVTALTSSKWKSIAKMMLPVRLIDIILTIKRSV